jgi:hypothetical protein
MYFPGGTSKITEDTVYQVEIRIGHNQMQGRNFTVFSSVILRKFTESGKLVVTCVVSCSRREAVENCVLLGCYATSGNFLPSFRDNQSVPSLKSKNPAVILREVQSL